MDCPSSLLKYNVNADMYTKPKKVKKVLHLHPGKQPHVHRIPVHGKGVYTLTGVAGTKFKVRPLTLQEKIHKHHFVHHPHGGLNYVPRLHPLVAAKGTSLYSAGGPHIKVRHPVRHPVRHAVRHPVRHRVIKVLKKKPRMLAGDHIDHHIRSKHYHSVHHQIPLTDPSGRVPHHGHLILHHKVKK